jgi:DNA repair exonuclease SbcCD ATPase subunit
MTTEPTTQEAEKEWREAMKQAVDAVSDRAPAERIAVHPDSSLRKPPPAQEAEKALETLEGTLSATKEALSAQELESDFARIVAAGAFVNAALAALRSLRIQLAELQEQLAQAQKYHSYFADKYSVAQAQHTKDREEIERLKGSLVTLMTEFRGTISINDVRAALKMPSLEEN